MPTSWPSSSSEAFPPLLIAAFSGRALAHAARRAGLACDVLDLFCDTDTRAACRRCLTVEQDAGGFACGALLTGARKLDPLGVAGVVHGGGFEAQPERLASLAAERKLFGNRPDVIRRVKSPEVLASLCHDAGIPSPALRREPPTAGHWLIKRQGGSGGGHVRHYRWPATLRVGEYCQQYVTGRVIGVSFVADGIDARVLGYAEQWSDSAAQLSTFVYGGAVSLDHERLSRDSRERLAQHVQALVAATGLRGLCGADFVEGIEGWQLIDVNPRPGATFELHEAGAGVLRWHLLASIARLPRWSPEQSRRQRAHSVVYAQRALSVPPTSSWPPWVTDRPVPGIAIPSQSPVCTVHAAHPTTCGALKILCARRNLCMEWINAWQTRQ